MTITVTYNCNLCKKDSAQPLRELKLVLYEEASGVFSSGYKQTSHVASLHVCDGCIPNVHEAFGKFKYIPPQEPASTFEEAMNERIQEIVTAALEPV